MLCSMRWYKTNQLSWIESTFSSQSINRAIRVKSQEIRKGEAGEKDKIVECKHGGGMGGKWAVGMGGEKMDENINDE